MKTEVLSLILSRPNVRTVEIADRLDMEPDAVRPLIADEIARGVIVEEDIVAPNGRTVTSFRYATVAPAAAVVTEAQANPFPARVLRALPPTERPIVERESPLSSRPAPPPPPPAADPLTLALSPAHVAPEHSDEPLEIDVSVTRKEGVASAAAIPAVFTAGRAKTTSGAKTNSRVELALACLRAAEGKPVLTPELASAMGLPPGHHPTSYLKPALAKGRVVRSGIEWTLGAGEPGYVLPAQVEPEPAPAQEVVITPETIAILSGAAQEPSIGACVAGIVEDCECDDCKTVAALQSELALRLPAAPVEQASSFEVPKFADIPAGGPKWTPEAARAQAAARKGELPTGGLPNIKTPYLPPVAEGAPDISRPGLYENGQFRKPAEEIITTLGCDASASVSENAPFFIAGTPVGGMGASSWTMAANDVRAGVAFAVPVEKFRAAIVSDGSMIVYTPGKPQLDLTPEQARELYDFMQRMGYAAWPKVA